jgi:hypothetical protein
MAEKHHRWGRREREQDLMRKEVAEVKGKQMNKRLR